MICTIKNIEQIQALVSFFEKNKVNKELSDLSFVFRLNGFNRSEIFKSNVFNNQERYLRFKKENSDETIVFYYDSNIFTTIEDKELIKHKVSVFEEAPFFTTAELNIQEKLFMKFTGNTNLFYHKNEFDAAFNDSKNGAYLSLFFSEIN